MLDIRPFAESEYLNISLRSLLAMLTSIDENSQISSSKGFFANAVHYRDLRRIDFNLNPVESMYHCEYLSLALVTDESLDPSILIRRHCAMMILDPLRVIVMADRFLLVVPDGADNLIAILEKHMKCNAHVVCRCWVST